MSEKIKGIQLGNTVSTGEEDYAFVVFENTVQKTSTKLEYILAQEVNELRVNVEELEKRTEIQGQQGSDAVHVLTRIPLTHEDLDGCGCEACERVRKAAIEVGYLKEVSR